MCLSYSHSVYLESEGRGLKRGTKCTFRSSFSFSSWWSNYAHSGLMGGEEGYAVMLYNDLFHNYDRNI